MRSFSIVNMYDQFDFYRYKFIKIFGVKKSNNLLERLVFQIKRIEAGSFKRRRERKVVFIRNGRQWFLFCPRQFIEQNTEIVDTME